jgi:iron(III) transport system substrate-binding protein
VSFCDGVAISLETSAASSESQRQSAGPVVAVGVAAALVLVAFWWSMRGRDSRLVVYCAHDAVFAEEILRDFERRTGIPLEIRFDTEATKSLGLVNLIRRERNHPRCDVFWNNELLGTVELAQEGLLEPYQGSGWSRLPERFRDPDGYWVGFGARLRVWIVNTTALPADEEAILTAFELETGRGAIAMPMFGTTLTHYAALHRAWGLDRLRDWHREVRRRGLREVAGNAHVKDLVASGHCDFGWTDTDDVFVALDAHAPVDLLPIRIDGKTLAIPNTAAIVRGTRQRAAAERLIDFLASAETELALARSRARQIPLGAVDEARLPTEVRRLRTWAEDSLDLRELVADRRAVLTWLRAEYVP